MKKLVLGLLAVSVGCLVASADVNLKACEGCHGNNFEKHALGKSKIVKDMSQKEIVAAIKGYKDGTYGGSMKAVMIGQVKNIKDPEAVAKAIAGKNSTVVKNVKKNNNVAVYENGVVNKSFDITKCKKRCETKWDKIHECIINAKDNEAMHKCRISIVNFGKKVAKKYHIK